jgi:hypothetical protein
VVVEDLEPVVEHRADAVADEVTDHRVAGAGRDRLDGPADGGEGLPGATASTPASRQDLAVSTSRRAIGFTRPTQTVLEQSPWAPPAKTVTSRLTVSPERSRRPSGMPWQMTSLTEVQIDFG